MKKIFVGLLCLSGAFIPLDRGQADMPSSLLQTFAKTESDTTEIEGIDPSRPLTSTEEAFLKTFHRSPLTKSQETDALSQYEYVDPNHMIPDRLLKEALLYYDENLNKIPNRNFLSVVDFSSSSRQERFFVINMKNGSVWALHVAHGSGSDPDNDSFAEKFSNIPGSNASSLGHYLTAETYQGKNGYSLRMDGLSDSNSNARARAVVVHGADYVYDQNVQPGRSSGCLAVSKQNYISLIDLIKGGSLIFAGI